MVQEGQGKIDYFKKTWEDLRIVPGAFQFAGSADPTFRDWIPGGSGTTFKVYEFNISDEVYFTCQLPHSYIQGEDIKVHAHWTPADDGALESGHTVAWKLDYSWANITGTFGVSTTADLTDTCTGIDHYHEMTPEVTVTGTDKHVSSMLVCKFYRDTGDTWFANTASNRPVLLEVDFHFPQDSTGSDTSTTKTNKNT